MIKIIFSIILGYLLGSIPFALVIGKVFYKTDIRQSGSGNLGGTNAGRILGKKAGIAVNPASDFLLPRHRVDPAQSSEIFHAPTGNIPPSHIGISDFGDGIPSGLSPSRCRDHRRVGS